MPALQMPATSQGRAAARTSSKRSASMASAKPVAFSGRKATVQQQQQRLGGRCAAVATAVAPSAQQAKQAKSTKPVPGSERDLNARHRAVRQHFPTALGVDDWMSRVESILAAYGFAGDNSIACTNLCRDEVTAVLKDKIEAAFGSSFNTNGLGGVLTCGATGMGAGLSHSPICNNGRERYVFFSFPHIAINSKGEVGAIARPGRAGKSCACGALAKALGELKSEGIDVNCKEPGVHEPLDPEYSILKQRLARRMRQESVNVSDLTLTSITSIAERTITSDLESLVQKAVDLSKADYAVVTGVQIHNWSDDLTSKGSPSLEFVAPTNVYVVIQGQKIELDLNQVPSLSPRQLRVMAAASGGVEVDGTATSLGDGSTLQEIPLEYLTKKLGGASMAEAPKAPKMGDLGFADRWQATVEVRPGVPAATAVKPAVPAAVAPAAAAAAVAVAARSASPNPSFEAKVQPAQAQPAAAAAAAAAPAAAAAAPEGGAQKEAGEAAEGNKKGFFSSLFGFIFGGN